MTARPPCRRPRRRSEPAPARQPAFRRPRGRAGPPRHVLRPRPPLDGGDHRHRGHGRHREDRTGARWANTVRNRFPDGQLHIDLRGFDHRAELGPAQVLHGFLEALGVAASAIPGDPHARAALYRSLVADRRMLVMLDNARNADQVRPLLPNSPTCLALITSRNRPDSLVVREGAHRIDLDVLPYEDAVRVLARRISPSRVKAEPEAVARLVRQCARLPLALRIVAARAASQPTLPLHRLAASWTTNATASTP